MALQRSMLALFAPFPALFVAGLPAQDLGPAAVEHFEARIRPILTGTCLRCHGGEKTSNGLRVDSFTALRRGGKRGAAIVPGEPQASLLLRAIGHLDENLRMPPDEKLPEHVVDDFALWIRSGAVWPQTEVSSDSLQSRAARHRAFRPLRAPALPDVPRAGADHPVDRFILRKLRKEGLRPVAPADRRTLLRRATFDLVGLPPTPEETEAFVRDEAPDAFSRVVDRLLASPHHGERWGRHWMDVVRYADTAGDNADYPIPEMRFYRDYIIDSFNADKPYDLFVHEQVAGDILAREGPREKYAEQIIATGFLALSRRYATGPYELWHLTLEDSIETTGRAFLGLTLRCARCHDHKSDPVTTEDYYAMYGFFASTRYPYAGSEEFRSKNFPRRHFVPLVPPDEAAPILAAHDDELRKLAARIGDCADEKRRKELEARRLDLQRSGLPPGLAGAYAVSDGEPATVRVQRRGDPADPGAVVPRGVPRFLAGDRPPDFAAGASGRRELARWLTDPSQPLTARVMVNRIWQHHFGRGIVATPSNFGLGGDSPSHPDLLDYLAARFIESGWSIKAMHRLIMLSRTYQLSGDVDEAAIRKDPDNRWLWRHDRRRLDAEAIRDAMLAVSGRLVRGRPDPHPFPPIAAWGWTQHDPFKAIYPSTHRSVYLMTQRLQRHPFLALFDGADPNHSTAVRTAATIPLQALYFMNNPFVHEQAAALARRLASVYAEPRRRIDLAHRLAYGRPADEAEVEKGLAFVNACREELEDVAVPAVEIELEVWSSYARILFGANEFVYLDG